MKIFRNIIITLLFCSFFNFINATSYTWTGTTSTAWNLASNWTPSTGFPGGADNATIVTHTNQPVLDTVRSVTNFTMTSGTLNLNGYDLTTTGTANFNGGSISNGGTLKPRGYATTFAGTTFNVTVTAICGYNALNGSTFNNPASFENTAPISTWGNGGNVFNSNVTIIKDSALAYYSISQVSGNTFNGDVKFINYSGYNLYISSTGNTFFNGNVIVGSTNTGGIDFGSNGGGTATLASGKTITVDSTVGFIKGSFIIRDFTQSGSTAQTFTLTGTAILNCISSTFNGTLNLSGYTVLLKQNIFNASSTLNSTGLVTALSYGGNIYNSTATLFGGMRIGTTEGDIFNDNVSLSTSPSREMKFAYGDTTIVKGNLSITGTGFVNLGDNLTGFVKFAGTRSQIFTTEYTTVGAYYFRNIIMDKDSNDLTFNKPYVVAGTISFIKGKIITTSTNYFYFTSSGAVTGANNSSFVSGPVMKVGNTAFIFPTGKGNRYRPIEISAPGGNTSDALTAEYFDAGQTLGTSMDTSIKYISNCDYWSLVRTNNSPVVNVKLSWDSTACGLMDSASVKVANWNGSTWKNLGNGGLMGSRYVGRVLNSSAVVTYGKFALSYNHCFLTANAGTDKFIYPSDSVTVGASPTASLGTGSYTYSWSPSTALSSSSTANPKASPAVTTNYIVTINDVAGCSKKDTLTVTYYSNPTANAGADQSFCSGDSITIGGSPVAVGGSSPYTYSWSPSTGLSSATSANPKASPSSTTNYIVTVLDANGHSKKDTVAITVHSRPSVNISSSTNISCYGANNGSATVNASGGTSPYTYSWSSGATTTTITSLTPGNYTITVLDGYSCSASTIVAITQPAVLSLIVSKTNISCYVGNDGSVTANVSGGTTPYSYSWSPSGGSSSAINNLAIGSYSVNVSDAHGCTQNGTIQIYYPACATHSRYAHE